jgi:pimeloyl-ACP methyl ester carboxylesterase
LIAMPSLRRPDGAELYYEERGDGPLVMVVPYWNGHRDVWADLQTELGRDHRVVTWDARGTGESTRTGPYDIETDCADLEAVLTEVGGAGTLVTAGNGCNIAVRVGAARPDLVAAVIAFGAGPFSRAHFAGSEGMIASDGVVDAFLEMLHRDYRGALRTILSATNSQMSEAELRDRVALQDSYCPSEAATARVHAWAQDDPTSAAAAIGERLWILSARSAAGPWLPPIEHRRRVIEELTPEAHVEETDDDAGPMSRPDLVAGYIRGITSTVRAEPGR